MSIEQNIENLEIRNANVVTFVGSSSTIVDTISGRIQCKGFQHNSNVITDISGPHGRGAAVLKKYPEILFADGKFDSNESTNTYVQAGYTVTDSSHHEEYYGAWIFDDQTSFVTNKNMWLSPVDTYTTGTPTMTESDARCTTVNGVATPGEWVQLKLPNKVKLSSISIMGPTDGNQSSSDLGRSPKDAVLAGSVDGTIWNSVLTWSGVTDWALKAYKSFPANVDSTNYYNYFRIIVTKNDGTHVYASIQELQLYGYEEDPPAGDHSVDTTIKSRFNNPQMTGVQVFVDGKGSGSNQISGGPTVTDTVESYDETGKYWNLTGELTSNISVEANTFLEGDQPHAVSVWFNSSNLEANVSNTCVFSISDQEHLNSENLKLQSNTWHNLTYAYQGEGGSRVTYLDGRKVAEAQAEDTFGKYPPFAMTGYSQGGYVLSVDADHDGTNKIWKAFDGDDSESSVWFSQPGSLDADSSYQAGYARGNVGQSVTDTDGTTHSGSWGKIEFPYKFVLNYVRVHGGTSIASYWPHNPDNYVILGSNDDTNWDLLTTRTGASNGSSGMTTGGTNIDQHTVNATKAYKYIKFLVTKLGSTSGDREFIIASLKLYGHRENDLVRLPDPTNVLKYPHIAMTGPAQRGYVFTASSQHSSSGEIYSRGIDNGYLFNGDPATIWHMETNGTDDHRYDGTADAAGGRPYGTDSISNFDPTGINIPGEWAQLELPHKVKISKVRIHPRPAYEHQSPKDFAFYGSDTGSAGSWTLIQSFTGEAPQDDGTSYYDITSNPAHYKYILMLITRVVGTTALSIGELEYYGTEEDISIPIQIGGGNIDKVANFRVYDKFIEEDQVNEIWNAQKEEFGRAKPQMVLQQGKLGIGTDAPQGSLSVADEPHNLEEFPPRAMTGYKNYFEGHGVFCVINSTFQSSGQEGWKAFNGVYGVPGNGDTWISANPAYNSDGTSDGTSSINGEAGEYLILEMPYNVKMKNVLVYPRGANTSTSSYSNPPKNGKIWGKNGIDSVWEELTEYSNLDFGATILDNVDGQHPQAIQINAAKAYKYIAFQVQVSNHTLSSNSTYTNIRALRYFGTREQGQSVLHDGQLTLTKNLTVPSIGPSVTNTRHAVPKRHKLVLEFDTSTNPTDLNTVRDTSGMGNDAALYDAAYYSAVDKAFKFDGNNDTLHVASAMGLPTGDAIYTISCWIKTDATQTMTSPSLFYFGTVWTGSQLAGIYLKDGNKLAHDIGSTNTYTTNPTITAEQWHHIAVVKRGTGNIGANTTYQGLFVDGVEITQLSLDGSPRLQALGSGNMQISIGNHFSGTPGSGGGGFKGCVSKPQIWNVALTAGDVKKLYDMGRGDSYHVTNFQNTLVGINLGDSRAPRSALDVRDQIYARTDVIGTFTGQHICFPDESMEKGLIVSAKKNQFVKLNGLAIGKSAITIDESLPIVSLSNVSQDKACFGVVSKMEESNTEYRTEITGGLVSESVKIAGDNRAIVNSVGEGAIWVVDTGGPLESGDYITTSNVAGYGQRQESEFLANYTVAKITMDCDFTASNVTVQTIKREETGTRTITEDAWNQLVDYDRSSNTETQYSNTLVSSAYADQSGYVPREVTTIVDYTDGSNIISVAEWSDLESNIQNTYQSNTFTEIVDYTKFVNLSEWSNLTAETQATYSEAEITTYYQIQRGGNVLDENGQLQFEDKTGATEPPYEKRFLTVDGTQTDEANAVHIAAFVGCTYHCG